MKAAVLDKEGTIPKYAEFPAPIPQNDNEVLITVKAATITQLDLLKSSGKHYTHFPYFPIVVGLDGIGVLDDGRLVYAAGITGMMGEKALVHKNEWTVLPDHLDMAVAAGLPNALVGSGVALIERAKIQPGQTILVNGATGLTGKVAVQLARYYGAKHIIGIGRNPESLESLKTLGATEVVSLLQDDASFIKQIKEIHQRTPVDVVIDYLWGHPVEMILTAFLHMPHHPVKLVAVGEMAGADITLPSAFLRSYPIELLGSGMGSFTRDQLRAYMKNILPEMFKLAANGQLTIAVETVALKDVQNFWGKESGTALVVII